MADVFRSACVTNENSPLLKVNLFLSQPCVDIHCFTVIFIIVSSLG